MNRWTPNMHAVEVLPRGRGAPSLAFFVVFVVACDDTNGIHESPDESGGPLDGDPIALIDHSDWIETPATDDPLADHRPPNVQCGGGWLVEGARLEVDTGLCNYLSLSAPLLAPIEAGDRLQIRLWWSQLAAIEPAEAHVALTLEDDMLWDLRVPIPGDADAVDVSFDAPRSYSAGSDVHFHLHNHGSNNWSFAGLSHADTNQ
jgi:hypothetical protein